MHTADLLDTLIMPVHKYSIEGLYKVVIIASIRTALAYFLGKEMKEYQEELEKFDGDTIVV
jgi:uncharacterized membrane protein